MLNPLMTNGLSHPYHLDESTIVLGVYILFSFFMKFISANIIAPDEMPRFAASHLVLFCLLDARLIRVKMDNGRRKGYFFSEQFPSIVTLILTTTNYINKT